MYNQGGVCVRRKRLFGRGGCHELKFWILVRSGLLRLVPWFRGTVDKCGGMVKIANHFSGDIRRIHLLYII